MNIKGVIMNNKVIFSILLIGLMGTCFSNRAMTDHQKADYQARAEEFQDDTDRMQEEIADLYSRKEGYLKGISNTQKILDMTRDEAEKNIMQEILRKDEHLLNFVQDQIDILEEFID